LQTTYKSYQEVIFASIPSIELGAVINYYLRDHIIR